MDANSAFQVELTAAEMTVRDPNINLASLRGKYIVLCDLNYLLDNCVDSWPKKYKSLC